MSPRRTDDPLGAPARADDPLLPRAEDLCGCGSERLESGLCKDEGLWPIMVWRWEGGQRFTLAVKCPWVCEYCRTRLTWDGGCYECHGSVTSWDKDTWTFPGDKYERDGWHWVKIDGPRACMLGAENAAGFAQIRSILAKVGELPGAPRLIPPVDPAIRAAVDRGAPRSP
jgi:hypothetical protein